MDRRTFLSCACAAGAICLVHPAVAAPAPAFASDRISVEVRGRGPDVLLIPGLGASPGVWAATAAAVPGYRYHFVHVKGFAGLAAGANAEGALLKPLAAELARYIAYARLAAPAVVGHSMGGVLAMLLAARHPGRAGRIMVVDILPQPAGLFGSDAASIRPLADSLRDMFGGSPGGREMLRSLMGRFSAGSGQAGGDPDVVAQAAHELAVLDLTPDLGRIAVPFSIVHALPPARSGADPARTRRAYAAAYASARQAKLVPIADSGHMVMLDQPAKFRAALKAFLA